MKILIQGGRLIDPSTWKDSEGDLALAEEKIVAVGHAPKDFTPDRVIHAAGRVVCPGFVDLSVRLREPGNEYHATLESELSAASRGGVTSLVCPPDTSPVLDEVGLVEMLKYRARKLSRCRVYPLGAMTLGLKGERLAEMAELAHAGCIGFSHADAPLTDTRVLRSAMQYASTFGYTLWLRAQDAHLTASGVAHDGEVATRLGLPGVPVSAETAALSTILLLAEETGCRVHVARLSSAAGIELIALAKKRNLPVTCDVSINHVHFSDRDIGYFDPHYHVMPPLRDPRDRDALRLALKVGTIDALTSDHTPVDNDAKQVPFGESEAGATGLELLLPATLKWAEDMRLDIVDALAVITSRAAKVLGTKAGTLAVGAPADVTIFDPKATWVVKPDALSSEGKNTPFRGFEVRGRVNYTIVSGEVVEWRH